MLKVRKRIITNKIVIDTNRTVTLNEAVRITGISQATLRRWIYTYKIGSRVGGSYKVDLQKLKEVIEKTKLETWQNDVNQKVKKCVCPQNYTFGVDYDKKPRCRSCHPTIWMHCADVYEKRAIAREVLEYSGKVYNKMDLDKKIQEMESKLNEESS